MLNILASIKGVIKKKKTIEKDPERDRLIAENTSDLICFTTIEINPTYTYVNPSFKVNQYPRSTSCSSSNE